MNPCLLIVYEEVRVTPRRQDVFDKKGISGFGPHSPHPLHPLPSQLLLH